MKKDFNRYYLTFIIFLFIFILFHPSEVRARSYKSDYTKLEKEVTFVTDEFELDLGYSAFSDGTIGQSAITGYGRRKNEGIYYYHYIIYYYNSKMQEIGIDGGYNSIKQMSTSESYFSHSLEQKNMYSNYELSDIKYYVLFIEPISEDQFVQSDLEEESLYKMLDSSPAVMVTTENVLFEDIEDNDYISLSSYDYVINDYKIEMYVNENNTFDIFEKLTVYFNRPKHGIYRKLPLKNTVVRLDGSKSNNRAQITNISVSEAFSTSYEDGYKIIKIGDSNKTFTGSKTYSIKYNYNIGKDPLKDADELYFNLIGDQWDTIIENVSFKIVMPKTFDKSLLGFASGKVGDTDSSNVEYSVVENVIEGTINHILTPGQALTVRLVLPEGYFIGAGYSIDKFSLLAIVMSLIFVLIAYILWLKYGKDEQTVETIEFYPPENYNSAEIGFLYEGSANNESIISLLIYLADKGYLMIEQRKEKMLFTNSQGFKITKLKDYDGTNEYEKIFFEGLFEKSLKSSDNSKINEVSVTDWDLHDSFYMTLGEIKSKMNAIESKQKIFESSSLKKNKWFILMIVVIFILITVKPVIENGEAALGFGLELLPFALIFPAIGFAVPISKEFRKEVSSTFICLFWFGLFGCFPWISLVLPCLLFNTFYLITYIIGIICVAVLMMFMNIMPKRTTYGCEMLGKIKGFKSFLETAEKEQLESLVLENPDYFYDILPYTYALGISDKWIRQFKFIAIHSPNWYHSHTSFNIHTFDTFMNSTMKSVNAVMSSSPSSGSGSSSGGGSSGGGSGGGGGGSW